MFPAHAYEVLGSQRGQLSTHHGDDLARRLRGGQWPTVRGGTWSDMATTDGWRGKLARELPHTRSLSPSPDETIALELKARRVPCGHSVAERTTQTEEGHGCPGSLCVVCGGQFLDPLSERGRRPSEESERSERSASTSTTLPPNLGSALVPRAGLHGRRRVPGRAARCASARTPQAAGADRNALRGFRRCGGGAREERARRGREPGFCESGLSIAWSACFGS